MHNVMLVLWLYIMHKMSIWCSQTCMHKIHTIMHINLNTASHHDFKVEQVEQEDAVQFEFTVTVNHLPSMSFSEPNASHDPVGEG